MDAIFSDIPEEIIEKFLRGNELVVQFTLHEKHNLVTGRIIAEKPDKTRTEIMSFTSAVIREGEASFELLKMKIGKEQGKRFRFPLQLKSLKANAGFDLVVFKGGIEADFERRKDKSR